MRQYEIFGGEEKHMKDYFTKAAKFLHDNDILTWLLIVALILLQFRDDWEIRDVQTCASLALMYGILNYREVHYLRRKVKNLEKRRN